MSDRQINLYGWMAAAVALCFWAMIAFGSPNFSPTGEFLFRSAPFVIVLVKLIHSSWRARRSSSET